MKYVLKSLDDYTLRLYYVKNKFIKNNNTEGE